jgi:serine/threonine protein kinase
MNEVASSIPKSGDRVGEYVLDAVLGRGAFGEVWRARHHAWTDRVVAVKIPTDPLYVRELQREGFAAPQLIHPNIVSAIAFDAFATPPYLAMEYVPGGNLRERIARGPMPATQATTILRQVLGALAHAHAQGVVHRDVKPENILIHQRANVDGFASPGAVMLTDFGLGQSSRRNSANSIAMSMSVASPEAAKLVGTLNYMSPEQRAGREVDARSDLYACGVVLFELLTGELPAGAEVPSDVNKNVPAWLDGVFRKAYARKDSRYTTADAFAGALGGPIQPPPLPANRIAVATASSCPRCRAGVAKGDQFCIHCGTQVVSSVRRCLACGAYPSADDQFCIHCGSGLPAAVAMT